VSTDHELDLYILNGDAHFLLDFAQQIRRKPLQQPVAELSRHVADLVGIRITEVQMLLDVRVVATRAVRRGQLTCQTRLAEGLERIVDGGEARTGL